MSASQVWQWIVLAGAIGYLVAGWTGVALGVIVFQAVGVVLGTIRGWRER